MNSYSSGSRPWIKAGVVQVPSQRDYFGYFNVLRLRDGLEWWIHELELSWQGMGLEVENIGKFLIQKKKFLEADSTT